MIIALIYRPLNLLRDVDVALALFWSSYLALWPGVLWWGFRI